MSNAIRLTVCDCCPIVRYGLSVIMDPDPDIDIVGSISSHAEMISNIDEINSDVLIVDLNLEDPSEIEYLREFRERKPEIKIIIFTTCQDKNLIIKILDLGIHGFRSKEADAFEIKETIHAVHEGRSSMEHCVTNALMDKIKRNHLCSESQLSKRENTVLNLIAKAMSNDEIADALYISTRTVKFHASSIFAKLDVKNRTEAALLVTRYGAA